MYFDRTTTPEWAQGLSIILCIMLVIWLRRCISEWRAGQVFAKTADLFEDSTEAVIEKLYTFFRHHDNTLPNRMINELARNMAFLFAQHQLFDLRLKGLHHMNLTVAKRANSKSAILLVAGGEIEVEGEDSGPGQAMQGLYNVVAMEVQKHVVDFETAIRCGRRRAPGRWIGYRN